MQKVTGSPGSISRELRAKNVLPSGTVFRRTTGRSLMATTTIIRPHTDVSSVPGSGSMETWPSSTASLKTTGNVGMLSGRRHRTPASTTARIPVLRSGTDSSRQITSTWRTVYRLMPASTVFWLQAPDRLPQKGWPLLLRRAMVQWVISSALSGGVRLTLTPMVAEAP